MIIYITALISIILGSTGQIFFKKGSSSLEVLSFKNIFSIILNPYLMTGLALYGISTILWINVLSKMKLSVAYPLISLGYIITFVFSALVLHEEIQVTQIFGLSLIIAGIIFITR